MISNAFIFAYSRFKLLKTCLRQERETLRMYKPVILRAAAANLNILQNFC